MLLLSYLYPTLTSQREASREAVSAIHLGTNSRTGVMASWGCGGQVIPAQEREGPEKGVSVVPGHLPSFTEGGTKQQEKLR